MEIFWALFFGMIIGVSIAFVFVDLEDRREEKRIEERNKARGYYDFACWVVRRNKPIDFHVGGE